MAPLFRTISLLLLTCGLLACVAPIVTRSIATLDIPESRISAAVLYGDSKNGTHLFVGQGSKKTALLLNSKDHIIGTVAAPDGIFATDSDGTLYDVPWFENPYTNLLLILAPPYQEARTINFRRYDTLSVAIDQGRGVFAVTTTYGGNGGGASYAYFFRRGASIPCATVKQPSGMSTFSLGAAFDKEGRLFVRGFVGSGGGGFAMITGECEATRAQLETIPEDIFPEADMQFNINDDLVIGDAYTGHVLTYAHPHNGQFGNPIRTTILSAPPPQGDIPYFRCFVGTGSLIWVNYSQSNEFSEYRYPEGGNPIKTLKISDVGACATNPPFIP